MVYRAVKGVKTLIFF